MDTHSHIAKNKPGSGSSRGTDRRTFLTGLASAALLPSQLTDSTPTVYIIKNVWGDNPQITKRTAHNVWKTVFSLMGLPRQLNRKSQRLYLKADCSAPLSFPDPDVLGPFLDAIYLSGVKPWETVIADTSRASLARIQSVIHSKHGEAEARIALDDGGSGNTLAGQNYLKQAIHKSQNYVYFGTAMAHGNFGYAGTLINSVLDFKKRKNMLLGNTKHLQKFLLSQWQQIIKHRHLVSVLHLKDVVIANGPAGAPEYSAPGDTIIIGRDPVAVDSAGMELVNGLRKENYRDAFEDEIIPLAEEVGLGSTNYNTETIWADRL